MKRLKKLDKYELLILDDIGYVKKSDSVWKNRRGVFSSLNEKRVGLHSDENTGDVASYGREFV
jgi:DNA replication protein DnaC